MTLKVRLKASKQTKGLLDTSVDIIGWVGCLKKQKVWLDTFIDKEVWLDDLKHTKGLVGYINRHNRMGWRPLKTQKVWLDTSIDIKGLVGCLYNLSA